jgi:hypothetical protein
VSLNKILLVDFVNKKVLGAYEGEKGQALTVIPSIEELAESRKRIIESMKRIDKLIREIHRLKKEDYNGN